MDKTPYITKDEKPGETPEQKVVLVEETKKTPAQEADEKEERVLEGADKPAPSKPKEQPIAPGPEHSALGNYDYANNAPKIEGEVETVLNPNTNPEAVEAGKQAGMPVFVQQPKAGE